ncbi:MAG: hypothetical protein O7G85_13650 [Planctomycetota bacterium]|nr:hypothetical protein [Planctomycetota bacterium]
MAIASLLILFVLVGILVPIPIGIVLILKSRNPTFHFPSCGRCGYDLTGFTQASDACPECGGKYLEVGIKPVQPDRPRSFRIWGIVLLVVPLLIGGVLMGGLLTARTFSQRANAQAVQARQQAAMMIQQRVNTLHRVELGVELDALAGELESTQDEQRIRDLEEAIASLQRELAGLENETNTLSESDFVDQSDR